MHTVHYCDTLAFRYSFVLSRWFVSFFIAAVFINKVKHNTLINAILLYRYIVCVFSTVLYFILEVKASRGRGLNAAYRTPSSMQMLFDDDVIKSLSG